MRVLRFISVTLFAGTVLSLLTKFLFFPEEEPGYEPPTVEILGLSIDLIAVIVSCIWSLALVVAKVDARTNRARVGGTAR